MVIDTMASNIEFNVNRNHLNPLFEGYRLETKNVPAYRINLKSSVCSSTVTKQMNSSQLQFNMDHMIACSSNNFLIIDPRDSSCVYFIDTQGNIMYVPVRIETVLPDPKPVASMDFSEAFSCQSAPRLLFDHNIAISSNGGQRIYIWKTLEDPMQTWKSQAQLDLPGLTDACSVRLLAIYRLGQRMKIATQHITEKGILFLTVYTLNMSTYTFEESSKPLKSRDNCVNLSYCQFFASNLLAFISDKPLLPESQVLEAIYQFEQTPTTIELKFKTDVAISFTEDDMTLCSETVTGQLYAPVKNFRIEGENSIFIAEKVEPDILWPHAFREESDDSNVTVKMGSSGAENGFGGVYMSPKEVTDCMEDCDMISNPGSAFVVMNLDTEKIQKSASLGSNQFLFEKSAEELCLKSDVDGLVWKVGSNAASMTHEATLNALSYVIAGKPNIQFKACSPDNQVVCITDRRMRAYVYHQRVKQEHSTLRNRKAQRNITAISTQQLLSLPGDLANEDIVGLQMSNERIYILTTNALIIFRFSN